MFSSLITSVRHIRNPATAGLATIASLWVAVGDRAWNDDLWLRIRTAADEDLGVWAQPAAVAFAAGLVGSFLWNLGLDRLVLAIQRWLRHPDWQEWIDQARAIQISYEEYRLGDGPGSSSSRVPSPTKAAGYAAVVAERERRAHEVEYRVVLAIVCLPLAVVLGARGGGVWWLSLGLPSLLWVELTLLARNARKSLLDYEIQDKRARLDSLRDTQAILDREPKDDSANALVTAPLDPPTSEDFAQRNAAEIDELENELELLESRRPQSPWLLGPSAATPVQRR